MRRLVLAAVLLLPAACADEEELPPPTGVVQGSLRIDWTVVDGTGATQTCEAALIDRISLRIGGLPSEYDCDLGTVQIDRLLPDRYPIVAQALGISGAARSTLMANGVVVAGSTTSVPLRFVIDPQAGEKGDLRVQWRVDSRDPRIGCAAEGADFARVVGGAGSIERFEERVPCAETEVVLRDLRAGVYVPEVRLETADGTVVGVGIGGAVRVENAQLAEPPPVNVITGVGRRTRLRAFWTVNSSAAPDACDSVRGRQVTFTTVPRPPVVASSTTVRCERGEAELSAGIAPGLLTVRLTLEHGLASSTSTTVRDVRVQRGETSTVTVDFDTSI